MQHANKVSMWSQFGRDIKSKYNQKFFNKINLPWMKSKELDILLEILMKLKPKHVFEWGSGYSTIYFPKLMSELISWHAIEHNEMWFNEISKLNSDKRVSIDFVRQDKDTVEGDGTLEEFNTYVNFPRQLNKKLDFIFIDGRARKHCLKIAFELVSDDGIVVVHDANRESYLEEIPPFKHTVLFTDYRARRGGIFIASKNRSIESVLDVTLHKKVWKHHDILAACLFMR